jgi:hypothetical protein
MSDLIRIKKAIKKIGSLDIYLVESDSTDKTINLLEKLQESNTNFSFISFGNLKLQFEDRIDRIRFCRNAYVDFIRKNNAIKNWNYILAVDLDGMNSAINARKIANSISKSEHWDACFANQTLGYYDLYALRAPGWVDEDCFFELRKLQRENIFVARFKNSFLNFLTAFWHFDKLRQKAIYSKMKCLSGDLISVNSAFGGFAIYKTKIFDHYDYTKMDFSSGSEHLDLHSKCKQDGLRLVIDPELKNNHWNEYNINKFLIIRFLKELKKFLNYKT